MGETDIERWITVCPTHGPSPEVSPKPHTRGCWYWSTDDVQCREKVEWVRLTNDRGAVEALQHIAESAEHPSLTVRTTDYLGHVARSWLKENGHPTTTTRGQQG